MDITIREVQTAVIRPALKGKAFYNTSMPVALRETQAYATTEGAVYSAPELADLRIQGNIPWNKWFTANTEELVGRTRGGAGLVAVAHRGALLTKDPERIEAAYEASLITGAGKIDTTEFQTLVEEGKHLDGSDANVYRLSEISDWDDLPYDAIILADKADLAKLPSIRQDIARLKDNPLVHMRLLGPKRAAEYLDAAGAAYGVSSIGNWHPFADINADQTQGRVVFLGDNDDDGLDGDNGNFFNDGRFVGVAPEAQEDSARSDAQNLEAELRSVLAPELGAKHLDRVLRDVLSVGLRYTAQPQE